MELVHATAGAGESAGRLDTQGRRLCYSLDTESLVGGSSDFALEVSSGRIRSAHIQ